METNNSNLSSNLAEPTRRAPSGRLLVNPPEANKLLEIKNCQKSADIIEEFSGILCVVSTDKDFVVTSPTSCLKCCEKKLNFTIHDVFPLKKSDCNEWRKLGASFYNVKCECGSSVLNKHWNHRLKGKKTETPSSM